MGSKINIINAFLGLNPFVRFMVKIMALYIGWVLFRNGVLSPFTSVDEIISETLLFQSAQVVRLFNLPFNLYAYENQGFLDTIVIQGTSGVRIDESCDGLQVMAVFLMFILAYPGKYKLTFALSGVLIVHGLNALRITTLVFIQKYHPSTFDLHHEYTLKIILYGCIVIMWLLFSKHFKVDEASKK